MKTIKKERKENARRFYETLMDEPWSRAAIVVKKCGSTTNPNINRTQFIAVPCGMSYGHGVVIAESSVLGIEGCFVELINFIKGGIRQKTYYEDGFDKWLEETMGFSIIYNDGLVIMLQRIQ